MHPEQITYALALAADLDARGEEYSARIVRRLVEERAELLAALSKLLRTVKEPEMVSQGFDHPPEYESAEDFKLAYVIHEARAVEAKSQEEFAK